MKPTINLRTVYNILSRRIVIIRWLPHYKWLDAVSDLIAGITVGLTLMPQAIAYAALAGLGPQYGLYSSFAGSLVYIIFGTIKEINIGPTALLSLLTYSYTHGTNSDFAVLLCFLSGCIELLCGILHLGFLVEFVSIPVTAGFSSAAAVIIASSQVKGLLGVKINSESFIETWSELMDKIDETRPWDLCLGFTCCVVLLLLRKLKDVKISSSKVSPKKGAKAMKQIFWLISTARNAMIVVFCSALAYYFTTVGDVPFILTGKIDPGLPTVAAPPFTTTVGNKTYTFVEMCSHLGSGIIVVPLISLLGNVAIAKAFANGDVVDATQEMITLGLCNIVGSFFRSMPVSGSFSRSAVNNASGVRTPFGGFYTGVIIIMALGFLTPYFYFIPRATLSSVIICAVIFMVEVQLMKLIWRVNKKDLVPAAATFLACLIKGVEIGILIGLAFDICYLLFTSARPKCKIEKVANSHHTPYLSIKPSTGILFTSADYIRSEITRAVNDEPSLPVILDCRYFNKIDFTAAQGLKALIEDLGKKNRHIVFHRMKRSVEKTMENMAGEAFLHSTSDAHLQQILKGFEKEITNENDLDIKLEVQDMQESLSSISDSQTISKTKF